MSKKTKVITSSIQPNPKEAEIWAKINEDGSREVKQYNSSTGKFECCGGSGTGSGGNGSGDIESNAQYYRIDWDKATELGYEEDGMNPTTHVIKAIINLSRNAKCQIYGNINISPIACVYPHVGTNVCNYIEFYPLSIYGSDTGWNTIDNPIHYIEEVVKESEGSVDITLVDCFIPSTKEEFYTI